MRFLSFLHKATAVIGFVLLFLAGCTEDWNLMLTLGKWGFVVLIPMAFYIIGGYIFGFEE